MDESTDGKKLAQFYADLKEYSSSLNMRRYTKDYVKTMLEDFRLLEEEARAKLENPTKESPLMLATDDPEPIPKKELSAPKTKKNIELMFTAQKQLLLVIYHVLCDNKNAWDGIIKSDYRLFVTTLDEQIEAVKAYNALHRRIKDKKLPSAPTFSKPFAPIYNGAGLNQLASLRTTPTVDAITGRATAIEGSMKVTIENYDRSIKGLRVSANKLLDAMTMVLTLVNHHRGKGSNLNTKVQMPLEEFMRLCNIPITEASKKETRKRANADLNTLFNLSIEWNETSKKVMRNFAKTRVCTSVGIKDNIIGFTFSPEMAKYLTQAYVAQFPIAILGTNANNPNAYALARKLAVHSSIDNNIRRGTKNIISVKKALEACPNIPCEEEVATTDRAYSRRIKDALEKALDAIPALKWHYCLSKSEPLTAEALSSFDDFMRCYIFFEYDNAPDQSERLKRRSEEAEKRAKKQPKKQPKKQ